MCYYINSCNAEPGYKSRHKTDQDSIQSVSQSTERYTGSDKKNQRKKVNNFLPIIFSICFGCSKEPSH